MSDGFSIGLLIMACLYCVAPEFIEENRLCWLRAPLYAVKQGKNTDYYFTDEDFNKNYKGKGEVVRFKGLGAMTEKQAKESMFSEKRRLDVLSPSQEAFDLLVELMGKDSQPKREFIFSNIDFSEIRE